MPTFEIEVDLQRQVLRTHFRGVVSAAALAAGAQRSAELIAQMSPGFTVVADLSQLERMDDLDCVPHLTRLMDLYRVAGVARVLRIIPDPDKDIGFTLLSYTHYRGQVPFETVVSVAEAERALASSAGRAMAESSGAPNAPCRSVAGNS